MKYRLVLTAVGLSALGVALIALPSPSATQDGSDHASLAQLQQKLEELQARFGQDFASQQAEHNAEKAQAKAMRSLHKALSQEIELQDLGNLSALNSDAFTVLLDEDDASWLGVETHDVTAEQAKQWKLAAERGVAVGKVIPDSPAAKAGLKEHDVITEIDGQRVEGAVQFRRMIHEIPAGRTVHLAVWRDARSQDISVTLGKAEQSHREWLQKSMPGVFAFRTPEVEEIPDMPDMENFNLVLPGAPPRLGIDAEDLNGQLGTFFGAPEGEAVLVREVNSGSPAEKGGLKAGDVITSLNGNRVRSVGELREKLAGQKEDRTVKLGVLRNKAELSLSVELPAPPKKGQHRISHRTNI